jgi:hypothetical protein
VDSALLNGTALLGFDPFLGSIYLLLGQIR